jgi:hypothetical protein
MTTRFNLGLATAIMLSTTNLALAEESILTLRSDQLSQGPQSFDMQALEAMPQIKFETSTVWTEGVQEFSGPSLKAVLAMHGLTGTTIYARALNDYIIEIPFDELEDEAPIIATRIDGDHFSRREKGPLWIIYPFDTSERFQTESTYGRSIWQLNELRVE